MSDTVSVIQDKEMIRECSILKEIKRHNNEMQYGLLDWILYWKENSYRKSISGSTEKKY